MMTFTPRQQVQQLPPASSSPTNSTFTDVGQLNSLVKELQAIDTRRKSSLTTTSAYLGAWFALGVICLMIYSFSACNKDDCVASGFHLASVGMMLAGAASSIGGLIGFLFGIPRTLAPRTKAERDSKKGDTPPGNGPDMPSQSVNTNLEDISDWLTKILVGVGLVQFQNIIHTVRQISFRFQADMGNSELAVLAIITTYFVLGFFAGYLFTRLFLTSAFGDIMSSEALRGVVLINAQLESEKGVLEKHKVLLEINAKAMSLSAQGDYTKADSLFQDAIRQAEESAPGELKQIIVQGTVFNSLYKKPPEGFEEAIRLVDEYLKAAHDSPSPVLLAYKGFAYGQKYNYESKQLNKKAEQLRPIRDAAYDAIKQALSLGPHLRDLIRSVWDPPEASEDRDLESFKTDEGFIALLGNQQNK